jgi:hypothetical protein
LKPVAFIDVSSARVAELREDMCPVCLHLTGPEGGKFNGRYFNMTEETAKHLLLELQAIILFNRVFNDDLPKPARKVIMELRDCLENMLEQAIFFQKYDRPFLNATSPQDGGALVRTFDISLIDKTMVEEMITQVLQNRFMGESS